MDIEWEEGANSNLLVSESQQEWTGDVVMLKYYEGSSRHTSKQYPNSICSFSPGCAKRPPAAPRRRYLLLRRPVRLPAAPLGPNNRPTKRYARVEISNDDPIKWTKTKSSDMRTMAPKVGTYASPHARAVRTSRNESR